MTTLENPRELRGLAIISKGGDSIARVSDAAYSVKSQSGEGRYAVTVGRTGNWYCECPDFTGRNVNCKPKTASVIPAGATGAGICQMSHHPR